MTRQSRDQTRQLRDQTRQLSAGHDELKGTTTYCRLRSSSQSSGSANRWPMHVQHEWSACMAPGGGTILVSGGIGPGIAPGGPVIELVFTVPDMARTRFATSPMDHLLFGALAAGPPHWVGASAARQ